MKVLSYILLLCCMLGCHAKRKPKADEWYCTRDVSANELIGRWIIASDSLDYVVSHAGIVVYTNRYDHTINLRADGSCAYRTFDDFDRLDPHNERERYQDGKHPPVPSTKANYAYWYLSDYSLPNDSPSCERAWNERYNITFASRKDDERFGIGVGWHLGVRNGKLAMWTWIWGSSPKARVQFLREDLPIQ